MLKPPKGLPWVWTPAGLRPEVARLASRPILVLPMTRFGAAPLEYARKQAAIVNGTGSAWVDSRYGPAMYFPNATFSAPTDYLTFPGAYPLSNGSIVPHSIAVLYSPSTSNGGHYPFALGSNATGTRSLGINCDFGGNKFNVVHFGVVGFASIGATPVIGRYYLQLYSYDQVTMNHMVVDLDTGAVASQSIAETRALVTASPGPYVGYVGGNEALQGKVVALAWVRGAWTINEMDILARNPTSLWTPDPARRRTAYKAPAASGTNVLPGAGALTLTGFAPTTSVSNNQTVTPGVGALTLSGFAPTATVSNNQNVAPGVGALTVTGFAPSAVVNIIVTPGVGALTLSGFAPAISVSNNQNVLPGVGALALSGFAPLVSTGTVIAPGAGVLTLSGFVPTVTASNNQTVLPGLGVLTLSGFAPTVSTPVNVLPGLGLLTLSGFAPTIGTMTITLGPRPFTLGARSHETSLAARSHDTSLDTR